MIAKLSGRVDSVGDDWAVIDVGGVGYLVSCSGRTLGRLAVGAAVALHVDTHVREDAIQLFGFADTAERDWFRLLITVQGVGAKVALNILSVATPEHLWQIIAAGDRTGLTRASGVGPKLAVRILTELKDKAVGLSAAVPAVAGGTQIAAVAAQGGPLDDAVSALANLGYSRLEAVQAVAEAAAQLGEQPAVSALIGAALKRLGREITR
jgi:Holliday junction DNA helicase RuvA